MKRKILITGRPGTGKTTLIIKLAKALADLNPVGFYTREIREEGNRVGFELIALDGRKRILSHTRIQSPYRVGKYKVDIIGFEDFLAGIPFLRSETRLIIVDEIGKMECFSERFNRLLQEILDSEKPVLATIAKKGGGIIEQTKRREDVTLFEITSEKRESLFSEIVSIMNW